MKTGPVEMQAAAGAKLSSLEEKKGEQKEEEEESVHYYPGWRNADIGHLLTLCT